MSLKFILLPVQAYTTFKNRLNILQADAEPMYRKSLNQGIERYEMSEIVLHDQSHDSNKWPIINRNVILMRK